MSWGSPRTSKRESTLLWVATDAGELLGIERIAVVRAERALEVLRCRPKSNPAFVAVALCIKSAPKSQIGLSERGRKRFRLGSRLQHLQGPGGVGACLVRAIKHSLEIRSAQEQLRPGRRVPRGAPAIRRQGPDCSSEAKSSRPPVRPQAGQCFIQIRAY